MTWVATAVVSSAVIGASTARSAAKTQAGAAAQASDVQQQQYEQTRADQAPYREAGYNALANLQRTAGNVPGAFKFGAGDYQADPGYAFRLSEGQKALDRQAAARGGLISGGALKAAQRYGQEMGSQEFGNAFNRALTSYNTGVASENQLYNRQAALSGIGQTATNLVGQANQNYGTSVGNALMNQGANAGNARMAAASAYGSALSGIGSAYGRNPVSFSSLYGGNRPVNFGGSGSGTFGEGDY